MAVEPAERERAVVGALRLAGRDRIVGVAHRVDGGAARSARPCCRRRGRGSTFSGASRKLRTVVPACSMRRSAISVASAGVADAHEVRPGAGAQAQAEAAVLARHLVGDRRPLEPDADLGALDAAAGLVGDAPLTPAPRGGRRCRGGRARGGTPAPTAAGSSAPVRHGDRALGRQARAEVDAVALDPWDRRATAGTASGSTSGGVGPRPSHQTHPSGRSTQRTSRVSTLAVDGVGRRRAAPRSRGQPAAPPPAPATSAARTCRVAVPRRFSPRPEPCRSGRRFSNANDHRRSSSCSKGSTARGPRPSSTASSRTWRRAGRRVHATREPSTGPVGRLLREILLGGHRLPDGAPADGRAMALLFAADRRDHLRREIEPALAAGIGRRLRSLPAVVARLPGARRRSATGSPTLAREVRAAGPDAAARPAGRRSRPPAGAPPAAPRSATTPTPSRSASRPRYRAARGRRSRRRSPSTRARSIDDVTRAIAAAVDRLL